MSIVNKLDSRIKNVSDIQSEVCYDNGFVGEIGYFADTLSEFGNLYACKKGILSVIAEEDDDLIFACKNSDDKPLTCRDWYEFFIPEKLLKPMEKKYRAFSLKEWCREQSIGNKIIYRYKGTYCGDHREAEVMYVGYIKPLERVIDEAGKGELVLGNECHGLQNLFENYEIWKDDEWKPFGIEIEE